jgi:branched-chain amino acid transport system permease protein
MEYLVYVVTLALIYITIVVAADLQSGVTGLVSLVQAGVLGAGAYATAICLVHLRLPYWTAIPAAMLAGAVASIAVALLSIRLKEDYFVIATIALQMVFSSIVTNWTSVTRGPFGIAGIPRPELFGHQLNQPSEMIAVTVVASVCTYWVVRRVVRSPLGRILQGVRDDEIFTQAMAKNPAKAKFIASIVSGTFIGLAGGLFAAFAGFIDPSSFTLAESIFILSMVILGGPGSVRGPALGAAILIMFPELMRFLKVPAPAIGNVRQILYGSLLVTVLMVRSSGIGGRHRPEGDS